MHTSPSPDQQLVVRPLEEAATARRIGRGDRPGELGQVSRKLGDAGVNITLAYLATSTRLVFAADDFAKAKAALL